MFMDSLNTDSFNGMPVLIAATEDFGAQTDLTRRINRAASELAGYLVQEFGAVEGFGPDLGDSPHSFHSTRTSGTTVDANVTDFSVLLLATTAPEVPRLPP